MKRTKCPYCGRRLSYFSAFTEKKKGEHTCKGCGRASNIFFSKLYKVLIAITIIISAILVTVAISPQYISNLWGMLWVAVPFLVLYFVTPFFLKLVPLKKNNKLDFDSYDMSMYDENANSNSDIYDDITSNTKIMSQIHLDDEDEFFDISDLNL